MTPDEALARFLDARVAHLATADGRAVPHIVPITFAVDATRIVTAVDAKPKRDGHLRRLNNIAANPAVSLLVDEYDEAWSRLWWARADGVASILDGGPDRIRALELLRARYPQYETVAIDGPVIAVDVTRWSGWIAGGR